MKKTYISIIGLGIAACMSSCSDDFLEKLPQGNYVEETYYVSDKALEAATAILYNRPWFEYNSEGALYISSMANECFDAWNAPEFNTMHPHRHRRSPAYEGRGLFLCLEILGTDDSV